MDEWSVYPSLVWMGGLCTRVLSGWVVSVPGSCVGEWSVYQDLV